MSLEGAAFLAGGAATGEDTGDGGGGVAASAAECAARYDARAVAASAAERSRSSRDRRGSVDTQARSLSESDDVAVARCFDRGSKDAATARATASAPVVRSRWSGARSASRARCATRPCVE